MKIYEEVPVSEDTLEMMDKLLDENPLIGDYNQLLMFLAYKYLDEVGSDKEKSK